MQHPKVTCSLLFVLCVTNCAVSQSGRDSLWHIWSAEDVADSIRFESFELLISTEYLFTKPDSAFSLAEILLEEAQAAGANKTIAAAYKLQAGTFYLSDSDKCREYLHKALEVAEQINDEGLTGRILTNIGATHYDQSHWSEAFGYWTSAMQIAERNEDAAVLAILTNNFGNLYRDVGQLSVAIEQYERSLKLTNDLGLHQSRIVTRNNLTDTRIEMGDTSVAVIEYIDSTLGLARQFGVTYEVIRSHSTLASLYYALGDPAYQEHIDAAEALLITVEVPKQEVELAILKGRIALDRKDYPYALKLCQKALEISSSIDRLNAEVRSCACLYDAYKAIGQGEEALYYHERLYELKNKLEVQQTDNKLQGMEFRKQVIADSLQQEEEKLRIALLHEKQIHREKVRKNTFMYGGIVILLMAIGLWSRLSYIRRSKAKLQIEKDRSDNLLLNILPAEVAEELKATGKAAARDFELVSVIFTDFKSFTEASEKLTASELVSELNYCFEGFDRIMEKFGIEKIKTIGDAYMAAGGLPAPNDRSVNDTVMAALEMQEFIRKRKVERDIEGKFSFEMRIGIHTGPVVAGIVGVKKFQYDIWGDTVNTASRMESNGAVGEVNISKQTYEAIADDSDFRFEFRGSLDVKGKGRMEMYFARKSVA